MAKSKSDEVNTQQSVRIKISTDAEVQVVTKYPIKPDGDCFYNSFLKVLELVKPAERDKLDLRKLRYSVQHKLQERDWEDFVNQFSLEFERAKDDAGEEVYEKKLYGYKPPFVQVINREFAKYIEAGSTEEAKEEAHAKLLSYGDPGKKTYLKMIGETNSWVTALEVNALRELFNLNIAVFVRNPEGVWEQESFSRFGDPIDGGVVIPVLSDGRHFDVVDPAIFNEEIRLDPLKYVISDDNIKDDPLDIPYGNIVILEPEVTSGISGAGAAARGSKVVSVKTLPSNKKPNNITSYDAKLTDEFYVLVATNKWNDAKELLLANKDKINYSISKGGKNVLDYAFAFISDESSSSQEVENCFQMFDIFEPASVYYPLGRSYNTIMHDVISSSATERKRQFFHVLLIIGDDELT